MDKLVVDALSTPIWCVHEGAVRFINPQDTAFYNLVQQGALCLAVTHLLPRSPVWFKRSRNFRPHPEFSHQFALRPWGNEAFLSPHHLPLCIEGSADGIHTATVGLLAAAREQQIPIFLLEGHKPVLGGWSDLGIPARHTLPPIAAGTTEETIRQTLTEVMDWLNNREETPQAWPALLLGGALGAHQHTVLKVLRSLNEQSEAKLSFIYVHRTGTPPLQRPEFAAQLYCKPDGRAQLRRHHGYHSFQLSSEPNVPFTPKEVRPSQHKSTA